ncbi:hypothetical protein [Desulfovibrio inopinatus]|uniref:hypothetical protein n=1 Tax=Desulfovibrio inopinatus TaxID=102109 RepID=UPI0003F7E026|nr:hypothetical protein [Desulfovibrio inopinatus]
MSKTNDNTTANDAVLEKELADLRREYERLRDDKVRAEQNLDNLTAQLKDLEQRAQTEYGTADPKELEELLATKRAENAKLVHEYREHITMVRENLDAVERGLDDESSV